MYLFEKLATISRTLKCESLCSTKSISKIGERQGLPTYLVMNGSSFTPASAARLVLFNPPSYILFSGGTGQMMKHVSECRSFWEIKNVHDNNGNVSLQLYMLDRCTACVSSPRFDKYTYGQHPLGRCLNDVFLCLCHTLFSCVAHEVSLPYQAQWAPSDHSEDYPVQPSTRTRPLAAAHADSS